jgi:hypothetical protein
MHRHRSRILILRRTVGDVTKSTLFFPKADHANPRTLKKLKDAAPVKPDSKPETLAHHSNRFSRPIYKCEGKCQETGHYLARFSATPRIVRIVSALLPIISPSQEINGGRSSRLQCAGRLPFFSKIHG